MLPPNKNLLHILAEIFQKDVVAAISITTDGLSLLYYKRFQEQLTIHFCTFANSIGKGAEIHPESLSLHITLLPKGRKRPCIMYMLLIGIYIYDYLDLCR